MDYIFKICATKLVENTSKHLWGNFIVGLVMNSIKVIVFFIFDNTILSNRQGINMSEINSMGFKLKKETSFSF